MSKGKKFFLVGQDKSKLLREQFHQALYEEKFIEEITDKAIVIEELNLKIKVNLTNCNKLPLKI